MSYSPDLASAFNRTRLRDPAHPSPVSGMCSMCTADCIGSCEIGLSAVRGKDAVYPNTTGENQVASEKNYPVDYSHFNINGRVFGAIGAPCDPAQAAIWKVDLSGEFGKHTKVKTELPLLLPALIKLNWKDYFAGAAMAGVPCVIGESAVGKDKELRYENGKVVHAPMLREMLDAFRNYDRGYGCIFLQCNYDDDKQGVPEYAIRTCGADAIEFKFGQSAKGTQPAVRVPSLEEALKKQANGTMIHPDPSEPEVQRAYAEGCCPQFYSYGSLPMWEEDYLVPRIAQLRALGLKHVAFKMAGYDERDLEHVLCIAAAAEVDLVTFDGAGGGSGYSPCKMMNEWSLPTVCMESRLNTICDRLRAEGLVLPEIAVTGGFATEDQVFKALALGGRNVTRVGLCRAAMAAAMSARKIGELLAEGKPLPPDLARLGATKEELFLDLPELRGLYGRQADEFSPGAVGVYSYLNRIAFGLQHFAALNRKFSVRYLDKTDLIPLTQDAKHLLDGTWMR